MLGTLIQAFQALGIPHLGGVKHNNPILLSLYSFPGGCEHYPSSPLVVLPGYSAISGQSSQRGIIQLPAKLLRSTSNFGKLKYVPFILFLFSACLYVSMIPYMLRIW